MNVSLDPSSLLQTQAVQNLNKGSEKVEGNTPDGDGDRDDAIQASSPAQPAVGPGSIGANINIIA